MLLNSSKIQPCLLKQPLKTPEDLEFMHEKAISTLFPDILNTVDFR